MLVTVSTGNVAAIRADTVIVAIDANGYSHGEVDSAIRQAAGNMFHRQIDAYRSARVLAEGYAVYADMRCAHDGLFGDVVFVCDGPRKISLDLIIGAGLAEANQRQRTTVVLPLFRASTTPNLYDEIVLDSTVKAIKDFNESMPRHVKNLIIVVYNDRQRMGIEQRLKAI